MKRKPVLLLFRALRLIARVERGLGGLRRFGDCPRYPSSSTLFRQLECTAQWEGACRDRVAVIWTRVRE
jgi:hypothetical protein